MSAHFVSAGIRLGRIPDCIFEFIPRNETSLNVLHELSVVENAYARQVGSVQQTFLQADSSVVGRVLMLDAVDGMKSVFS